MKVLLNLGDAHIKYEPYYNYGISKFIDWFDKSFPDKGREITEIFLTGDVLDKVAGVTSQEANAYPFMEVLKKKAKYIYTILGNHDYGIKSLSYVSNKEFLESLGITVITENCEYTTKLGFNVLCLPWHPSYSYDTENNFIENHLNKEYDCVVSHWETEPLFTENFVNISKLKSKIFSIGHIHTFGSNYVGSLLPNSSSEQKSVGCLSVVRALYETNEVFNHADIPIPSFVDLREVKINSYLELSNLISKEELYYKIKYNRSSLDKNTIIDYCKEHNVNIYKNPLPLSVDNVIEIDESGLKLPEFSEGVSKRSIIEACKEELLITDEEENKLLNLINQN